MSANAPSDEAWAILLTQVAELQAKVATLENKATVVQHRLTALEQEPGLDEFMLEFNSLHNEIRAIVNYIAKRDDVAESKVC